MIACKCSERFVSVLLIVTVDSSLNVRVHASGNRYFLARTDTRTRTCVRAHTQESGGYGGRDDSVDRTRRSNPSLTVPCAVERKLGDRSVSRKSHHKQLEAFGHVIMYKEDSHLSCHRDLRGKMHVNSTILCTADALSSSPAPSPLPPPSSV